MRYTTPPRPHTHPAHSPTRAHRHTPRLPPQPYHTPRPRSHTTRPRLPPQPYHTPAPDPPHNALARHPRPKPQARTPTPTCPARRHLFAGVAIHASCVRVAGRGGRSVMVVYIIHTTARPARTTTAPMLTNRHPLHTHNPHTHTQTPSARTAACTRHNAPPPIHITTPLHANPRPSTLVPRQPSLLRTQMRPLAPLSGGARPSLTPNFLALPPALSLMHRTHLYLPSCPLLSLSANRPPDLSKFRGWFTVTVNLSCTRTGLQLITCDLLVIHRHTETQTRVGARELRR